MYCKHCAQPLRPGSQVCPRCGCRQTADPVWSTSSEWFIGWEPLLYIASFFFPIFAIIIWAMYHQSPSPKTRNFVRTCVICAIAAVALGVLVPCFMHLVMGVLFSQLLKGQWPPVP